MGWLLADDTDFAGAGAALAVAVTVFSLVGARLEAWPFLIVAGAVVVVRGRWRAMPALGLILGAAIPVFVVEAAGAVEAGWIIVCVALLVAAAGPMTPIDFAAIGLVVSAPFWLWVARVEEYLDFGPWIWIMGLALSAAFGVVLGRQRALIDRLEEQQVLLAQATANEERRRIARELHDLVGHSFSVVMLHVAGARRLIDGDPQRARQALVDAEAVGRRSMDDLCSALWMLRSDDEETEPVRGVDALPELVGEFRSAGLDAHWTLEGDVQLLDAAASLVLYSVGREALTNAAKHGSPGCVTVRLDATDDPTLTVVNAAGQTQRPPGVRAQGLTGMRERVRAIGGHLDAGYDDGSWRVTATLPATNLAGRG